MIYERENFVFLEHLNRFGTNPIKEMCLQKVNFVFEFFDVAFRHIGACLYSYFIRGNAQRIQKLLVNFKIR